MTSLFSTLIFLQAGLTNNSGEMIPTLICVIAGLQGEFSNGDLVEAREVRVIGERCKANMKQLLFQEVEKRTFFGREKHFLTVLDNLEESLTLMRGKQCMWESLSLGALGKGSLQEGTLQMDSLCPILEVSKVSEESFGQEIGQKLKCGRILPI